MGPHSQLRSCHAAFESLESRRLLAADLVGAGFYIANATALGASSIAANLNILNSGTVSADAGAFDVRFYWSATPDMTDGDEVAADIAPTDPFYNASKPNALTIASLAGNSIATRLVHIAVPANQPVGSPGDPCYLGIRIDEPSVVAESNEANNSGLGEDIDSGRVFWMNELYAANMTSDPGWTLDSGWQWGAPSGQQGDPAVAFTGANVTGYNLQGAYPAGLGSTAWARTPAFSTLGFVSAELTFRRWLGVERSAYDHAYIAVSSDTANWTTLWSNPTTTISESRWSSQTYVLPAAMANQATVYIRFGMGTTDAVDQYAGWNIDDVVVRGRVPTPAAPGMPDLVAESDTGASSIDNLLSLDNSSSSNRITFDVPGTVAGATVTLFAGPTAIASAVAAGTTTRITTSGTLDLADGGHQISARQSLPGASESAASAALAITIDTVAPFQQSFGVGDGHVQRSMVKELQLAFSEAVSGSPSLLTRNGSAPVGVTIIPATSDSRTFTFTFDGTAVTGHSLPDGLYNLFVSSAVIGDLAGNALVADVSNRFHRLFGDADGDRDVDKADSSAFRATLNRPSKYVWYFDADGDLLIDRDDLEQLKGRLSRSVLL